MRAAPKAVSAWLPKRRFRRRTAGVTGDHRSQSYTRDRRIVKTDEFSSVFRLRPVQRTAHFVLYVCNNRLPHARLGVVAAKRLAPRAVTRNTIKRIARELFRQTSLPAIDCIVRLHRPVSRSNNGQSGSQPGPATSAALKAALRLELSHLFASQVPAKETP